MIIQHNIPALNSYNKLNTNNSNLAKNLEKLSSGYRINRAGDDAAGLAISEKMRAQITGLEMATRNAKDGVSLIQTAEGALTEVHSMLNRLVELATQSANGTYQDGTDRKYIQKEVDELLHAIDQVATTDYNGIQLLDGTLGGMMSSSSMAAVGSANSSLKLSGVSAELAEKLGSGIKVSATGAKDQDTVSVAFDGTSPFTAGVTLTWEKIAQSGTGYNGSITFKLKTADAGTATAGDLALMEQLKDLEVTFEHGEILAANAVAANNSFSSSGTKLQVGDKNIAAHQLSVSVQNMSSKGLGLTGLSVGTAQMAMKSIDTVKAAIDKVNEQRDYLGAKQNRLEHTINNLETTTENLTDAESRIRDTDMAKEMMKYTKNSILVQSAQAMLAQANQLPSSVLNLLY